MQGGCDARSAHKQGYATVNSFITRLTTSAEHKYLPYRSFHMIIIGIRVQVNFSFTFLRSYSALITARTSAVTYINIILRI